MKLCDCPGAMVALAIALTPVIPRAEGDSHERADERGDPRRDRDDSESAAGGDADRLEDGQRPPILVDGHTHGRRDERRTDRHADDQRDHAGRERQTVLE